MDGWATGPIASELPEGRYKYIFVCLFKKRIFNGENIAAICFLI